jgi:hypothetical protein
MATRKGKTTPEPAKPHTSAAKRLAQQRAEVARRRIAMAQRRRRMYLVGGPVLGVVLIVGSLVAVKLATGSGQPKSGVKASQAASSLTAQLSAIPSSVLDAVGVSGASAKPSAITAPPLTEGGKPMMLYVGADYCPFCAAERWAIAVALQRFGTLSGLGQTASSPSDVYPSTATLSFHGTTFTSQYLALTAKEIQSNQVVNGQYAPLDTLTATEQNLFSTYDKPPYTSSTGSIPFVDIGGKYVISGATYSPAILKGKTQAQIAAALSDPASPIARAVGGSANLIAAAICAVTSQQPAKVCNAAGVQAGAAALGSGG